MNAQLIGRRGAGQALRDVRGKKMFADGLARPEPGAQVQLSLDSSVQAIAEAAVEEGVRIHKARSGTAVVLEVGTGRVIAMASAPARDPNADENHASARNRAVADSYEAGSVMKVFSVAAALDDGLIKPDTEIDLGGGQLKLPGRTTPIRDVDHDAYLDVAGIIKRSSNVGAAKIALKLGAAKLYAAYRRFGFGKRTGVELPGEQPGLLRDGAKWRDVELATIAFGYGLTATPIQLAAALAAFGDRGLYHEPRIVDRVIDPDGTLLYEAAPATRQVVSERTATQMKAMLASVFEGGKLAGTGAKIVVPGFRCGGKTGTANKYDPVLKGYSPDHYLSTFAGLAPIDHPRLAIVVLVDDPIGGDHMGAKVAGPIFARVASEALRYLGVPGTPDVCPPPVPGAPPSIEPKTCLPAPVVAAVSRVAAAAQIKPAAPAGPPVPPVPPVPAIVEPAAGDDATAPGDDATAPTIAIPDFRGMGMARAIAAARAAELAIDVSGTGRVVAQDPAPGARLAQRVVLRFSDGNSPVARTVAGAP
jgi:cell division protein FtsI (penicillin-binding protein 3)